MLVFHFVLLLFQKHPHAARTVGILYQIYRTHCVQARESTITLQNHHPSLQLISTHVFIYLFLFFYRATVYDSEKSTATPTWYVLLLLLLINIIIVLLLLNQTSSEINVNTIKAWCPQSLYIWCRFNLGISTASCPMMFYLKFDLKRTTLSIKKEISF